MSKFSDIVDRELFKNNTMARVVLLTTLQKKNDGLRRTRNYSLLEFSK